MSLHAIVLFVSLALAGPVRSAGPPQEGASARVVEAAQALAGELDKLRQAVEALEARVAALEAAGEPEPPPPDPGPDPAPEPEPAPPPPPREFTASWMLELRGGQVIAGRGAAVARTLQTRTGPVELCILDEKAGPLRLSVVWEDIDGAPGWDPQHWTAFLRNAAAGRGQVYWNALEVRVMGRTVIRESRGVMPPRMGIPRTSLDLNALRLIPETLDIPSEIRTQALNEIAESEAEHIGPYPFFLPATDGGKDPTNPGGRATAPFHGGSRDWLSGCAEGLAYRLAEAMCAASRGLWCENEDGSPWHPGPQRVRYWWQAASFDTYALEWMQQNQLPGWGWKLAADGWCPYEAELAARPPADRAHSGRWYKAWCALAPKLRVGTWFLVHVLWPEVDRAYPLDERVPGTDLSTNNDNGYAPLWQLLKQPGMGSLDRGDAHMIMLFAEASPYLDERTSQQFASAFAELLEKCDDGRGLVDHSYQGDAAASGVPGPATLWFQNAMMVVAARWLSEVPGGEPAGRTAGRLALWWTSKPSYVAHTGGRWRSVAELPPHLKHGTGTPEYVWCTLPEIAPPLREVLRLTIGRGLGEPPADYFDAWR